MISNDLRSSVFSWFLPNHPVSPWDSSNIDSFLNAQSHRDSATTSA